MKKRNYTTTEYLLLGLIPFTQPNLRLAYSPAKFYYELERVSRANQNTLQSTMSRARRKGLVERINGVPVLTKKGLEQVMPYQTKKIGKASQLMVIFDIPEEQKGKRRKLRDYLKYLDFKQVQKSVWVSDMDYRSAIKEVVADLDLNEYVQVFEAASV